MLRRWNLVIEARWFSCCYRGCGIWGTSDAWKQSISYWIFVVKNYRFDECKWIVVSTETLSELLREYEKSSYFTNIVSLCVKYFNLLLIPPPLYLVKRTLGVCRKNAHDTQKFCEYLWRYWCDFIWYIYIWKSFKRKSWFTAKFSQG